MYSLKILDVRQNLTGCCRQMQIMLKRISKFTK